MKVLTQQKPVRILKINCRKSHQISWNSDGLLKSYNAKYTKEGVCIPLREIQSPFFFLYLQNDQEFFDKILQLWSKFEYKHFEVHIFKI